MENHAPVNVGFFTITHNLNGCIYGQIDQSSVDASTLEVLMHATNSKTHFSLTHTHHSTLPGQWRACKNSSEAEAFLSTSTGQILQWSSALIVKFQAWAAGMQSASSNPQNWNPIIADAGSLASMISSTLAEYTTTLNTEIKATQSQLNQDIQAVGTLTQSASPAIQLFSVLPGILGQISVG